MTNQRPEKSNDVPLLYRLSVKSRVVVVALVAVVVVGGVVGAGLSAQTAEKTATVVPDLSQDVAVSPTVVPADGLTAEQIAEVRQNCSALWDTYPHVEETFATFSKNRADYAFTLAQGAGTDLVNCQLITGLVREAGATAAPGKSEPHFTFNYLLHLKGNVALTTDEGYTFRETFDEGAVGPWTTDVSDDKPGFAHISLTDVGSEFVIENTTPERTTSIDLLDQVLVGLYPKRSLICRSLRASADARAKYTLSADLMGGHQYCAVPVAGANLSYKTADLASGDRTMVQPDVDPIGPLRESQAEAVASLIEKPINLVLAQVGYSSTVSSQYPRGCHVKGSLGAGTPDFTILASKKDLPADFCRVAGT